MFRGISAVNLDPKGRMAMPKRYREAILNDAQGQMVVTIDTDATCLLLYPLPDWEVIERKLEALPGFNPQTRRIQRLLMGHATEVELDAHGRLLLPPLLRDYAQLEKDLILLGQGKKFEIWSQRIWDANRAEWLAQESPEDPEALSPELKNLSL